MDSISTVGVAGCGRMGSELFLLFESAGFKTTLFGRRREAVEERRIEFLKALDFALREEAIDEAEFGRRKEAASFVADPCDLTGCDLVVEAIAESAKQKRALLASIGEAARPDTVFASCSSSIAPSELAPSRDRLQRTVGLHFFHPPKFVGVAELVLPPAPADGLLDLVLDFLGRLDKSHILETEAEPFIVNRCLLPLQAQAYRFVEEGRASFGQMDCLVREGLMSLGVFEMFDRIGIDVAYPAVARYARMQPDLRVLVSPLEKALKRLAEAGRPEAGRRAGFRVGKDAGGRPAEDRLPEEAADAMRKRLMLALVNQVYYFVEKRAALQSDLASALEEAFGLDVGIRQRMGGDDLRAIGDELGSAYEETGDPAYRPRAPLAGEGTSQEDPCAEPGPGE